MKAVILAGGKGTRLSEETISKPKPLVEVGERPILWHIMKIYSAHGINDFVICSGYRGYLIKEYFANYFLHMSDVTFDMARNEMEVHHQNAEPWRVTIVDTGEETMTGGRIKRIEKFVSGETFCCTYGDGVGDVDIRALLDRHGEAGKLATLTGVQPPGRFGALDINEGHLVSSFQEKPEGDGGWINGGFFVLEPGVFEYLGGDDCVWEQEPLRNLARDGELAVYEHDGFWRPMDTLRDKATLEGLWDGGEAPWKIWN
ncbi:MAG: glucose-1-phosphate cytidylyltransferase [Verrucomicrobiota bacterium]